tara:strand:+ start:67 stop:276 length:210 start_codon:yes stop_codon:yes gene_type:complete
MEENNQQAEAVQPEANPTDAPQTDVADANAPQTDAPQEAPTMEEGGSVQAEDEMFILLWAGNWNKFYDE